MNKKKNLVNKTFTNAMVVWLVATMLEQGITEESIPLDFGRTELELCG